MQLYRIDEIINSMMAELSDLRAKSTLIESMNAGERVSGSGSGEPAYVGIVNKIVDMEAEIRKKIDKYFDLKSEINAVIDAVEDADERLLLRYRYVNFYDWETIAKLMNYSERNVYYIHGQALKHISLHCFAVTNVV